MKKLLVILGCSVVLFGSVDVNHASVSELSSLHGIGEKKATKIVQHIKENGCFKNVDQLSIVKGISQKTILKNKKDIQIIPCKK